MVERAAVEKQRRETAEQQLQQHQMTVQMAPIASRYPSGIYEDIDIQTDGAYSLPNYLKPLPGVPVDSPFAAYDKLYEPEKVAGREDVCRTNSNANEYIADSDQDPRYCRTLPKYDDVEV